MTGAAFDWNLLWTGAAPGLAAPWLMQLGLTLGWALVLAVLGATLGLRLHLNARRLLAAGMLLWTLLPGPLTPDYWLGLAFHAPSLSAMLLCGWCLQRLLFPAVPSFFAAHARSGARLAVADRVWLLLSVLLGWVLLLDTFAVLPWQIYVWGFSPLLLLVLLLLSLLPWLLQAGTPRGQGLARWLLPATLLLFAATRLPTGNVWDALLDPWLWLVLQGLSLRALYRRWRA